MAIQAWSCQQVNMYHRFYRWYKEVSLLSIYLCCKHSPCCFCSALFSLFSLLSPRPLPNNYPVQARGNEGPSLYICMLKVGVWAVLLSLFECQIALGCTSHHWVAILPLEETTKYFQLWHWLPWGLSKHNYDLLC